MNVALYARVSTHEQTCEVQLSELRQYAEMRKLTVVREFSDVISGSSKERPGLDELMALVRERGVDAILVVKLDRLARSLVHFSTMAAEFLKLNVALICTTQGIDTSTDNPCGKFQQNILAAVAEFERDLIRERTKAGLVAAKARGMKLGRTSSKMPADPAERIRIVVEWRKQVPRLSYRDLGHRLGGVSAATAMRLDRSVPIENAPVIDVEV